MGRTIRWEAVIGTALSLLLLAAGPAQGKPAYAKAEKKACSFCHVGKTSDKVFTDAGKHYAAHHSLAGYGEKAAEVPPPKEAEGAVKPVATSTPAAEKPASTAAASSEEEAPCDCGCKECREKRCGHHGHRHGGERMEERMGKMKEHLEQMRRAIAGLREGEKKLEASAGSDPFRAAVLEQLRKLTDLQASHLEHMEGMMGSQACRNMK
ncbi:MAG: hypothetical protein Kow00128_09740 [Deltaproteobacteria bacterium]